MGQAGRRRPAAAQVRLNWRLYRLCLAPALAALLIAAFSLGSPPPPLGADLAPEAFEGARAFSQLRHMAAIAPSRQPGSRGDARLLTYLSGQLRALGSPASGGYSLLRSTGAGQTTWGQRSQTLLIARRAGSGSQAPIALIARRDSARSGDRAQLSGAAALLEIATVLAQTETRHPVEVVFSDGGSSGDAAIERWLRSPSRGRLDAAIVLEDLAGSTLRPPLVQPFSTGFGGAPEALSRTVSSALRSTLRIDPGTPSLASQLAHLAFPLAIGEQGPINGAGVPSVAVSLAGERGPSAGEPVSQARLQAAGRAVLSAFYALDRAPEVPAPPSTGLLLSGRVLPQWSIALLALSLLIGPLALACDALVRMARHGHRPQRWLLLPLSCAWPLALCAAIMKVLAAVGLLPAPPAPVAADALSFGAGSVAALIVLVAALALCWRLWRERAPAPRARVPASGIAGVAVLCSGCLLALLVWLIDPYAALLLVPALHLWLLAVCPQHRPQGRLARLALVLVPALAPLALLIAFYALSLGLGPAQGLLEALGMIAGGYVSWGGALLWSVAGGLLIAIAIVTLGGEAEPGERMRLRARSRLPALGLDRPPVYRERAMR